MKIRKNTREEYIDSDAIYIYTRHSSADTSPWKDRGRRRRSDGRKEKGGTVSPRWKISSIVINPRADALRSKGENRSEYRKGGVVGCVTGPKLEGRRFIVQSINEFPMGSKNYPSSPLIAIGTVDKVVLDATRLMKRKRLFDLWKGREGKREKKKCSIEVDEIWGGKSSGSNSMHRCCGDW